MKKSILAIFTTFLTSVCAIGENSAGPSSNQTENVISVAIETLVDKGMIGFAEVLGANIDGVPAIEFDTCDEAGADLAQAIFAACEHPLASGSTNPSDFKALLRAEQWVLKKDGARNLVLAYAIEENAWRLLAYRLKSKPSDHDIITNDIAILRDTSPGYSYWLSVARQLWPDAIPGALTEKAENMAFAELLDGIAKSNAKPEFSNFVLAKQLESNFSAHFASPGNEVVFLMGMRSAVWSISLNVVSEIALRKGTIPDNRLEFIKDAIKFAGPILDKRDRLGGGMTAGHAWSLWKELTK